MKSVFVGDRYQSGANKNEIRFFFVFVCIRRVKATTMCILRSNYPFLFLFLSRIRKGLQEVFCTLWTQRVEEGHRFVIHIAHNPDSRLRWRAQYDMQCTMQCSGINFINRF
jgi:hypothetical protein